MLQLQAGFKPFKDIESKPKSSYQVRKKTRKYIINNVMLINRVMFKGSHQTSCITQRFGSGGKGHAGAETYILIKFHYYFGICYSLQKIFRV